MKFKFTDENGNDYEVEIKAKDIRNLKVSKKATRLVLVEMANIFGAASYSWRKTDQPIMAEYASKNAQSIIDIIL